MIRFLVALLILTFPFTLPAQEPELNVKSFRKLENDLDARITEPRKDQNGDLCAILKIVTVQKGFSFDCGQIGIVKTVQKPSEIWVYVPYGVKRITISHPQLGILRDYMMPQNIEKASVYELVLISGSVVTTVQETIVSQWLVITPDPSDAMIYINDKFIKNGIYQGKLKPGEYTYRVEAPLYHPVAGKIEITNMRKELAVKLKPSFGYITIMSEPEVGAKVLIDGEALGRTTPCKSDPLTTGEHTIQVVKDLFQPDNRKVTVEEGRTTSVNAVLVPNFAEISIALPEEAELFIDNLSKGKGNWQGHLGAGVYTLEAKMDKYRTARKDIEVVSGEKQKIDLKPTPLYGSVDITSIPAGASISVNRKPFGNTPNTINNLPIGDNMLQLSLPGYKTFNTTVKVEEGKSVELNQNLTRDLASPEKIVIEKPYNSSYYKYRKQKMVWLVSGLVSGATGTICLIQSNKYYTQYQNATTDATDLHQKIKTLDTIYPICFAITGFAAVEFILISGKQAKAKKQSLDFSGIAFPGGAVLSISYNF